MVQHCSCSCIFASYWVVLVSISTCSHIHFFTVPTVAISRLRAVTSVAGMERKMAKDVKQWWHWGDFSC